MRAWILAFYLFVNAIGCKPTEEKRPPAELGANTAEKRDPTPTAPRKPDSDQNDDEACGQLILIAYKGASLAPKDLTRQRPAAQKRAQELLEQLQNTPDQFADLARKHSDAPSSAARGGTFGTYRKDNWPELYNTLQPPLFALRIHEIADQVLDTPHGYALLRRCPIEKAHARHILVRYAGAKRAPDQITRDKPAAKAKAQQLLQQLETGADFAALAQAQSEDPSAERGGNLGYLGKGLLAAPFEQALFQLPIGGRSPLIETDFGYHIIERLPPPPTTLQQKSQ